MTERQPKPGELCTCGRPARTVFVLGHGRPDVGYCGIPDPRPQEPEGER